MKRFLSLALIFVLVFALAAPAALAAQQANGYTEVSNAYGAVAGAVVNQLSGSQNGLTITVKVGGVAVAEEYFLIPNNSAGEFKVGDYKVYVGTSGNTKIDYCFITYAPAPSPQDPVPGILKVVNPRPSRAPIDAVALTPRLASLANKTVAVIANYDMTMQSLAYAMLDAAPGIKVIFVSDMEVAAGQSPRPVTLDEPIINMSFRDFEANPKVADAIVFGNGF